MPLYTPGMLPLGALAVVARSTPPLACPAGRSAGLLLPRGPVTGGLRRAHG